MKTMRSMYETKTHFSEFVAEVERTGIPIVVTKHGKPVVDLVPHGAVRDPLAPDPALQGARLLDEPVAPLDPEDWPEALR